MKEKTTTDLISFKNGSIIDLHSLPPDLQEKINQYAMFDILKDQAKEKIKAVHIDIEKYVNQWIAAKESDNTKVTYRKAIQDFFGFVKKIGIEHPLLIKAEHVDQYILELKNTYRPNSIRLKISACSSFYSLLKRYRYVKINPFKGAVLPRKEYRKAVNPDQRKTIPVMNEKEYESIIKQIKQNCDLPGKHVSVVNARSSAKNLLPAVHFMAAYGLRVGAIPTVEIKGKKFSFTTKGGKSYTQELKRETISLLKEYGRGGNKPFRGYRVITIQKAFKRVTDKLKEKGIVRYNYVCHDLRHFFACSYYMQTKDIVGLKNILGHASLNVTDVYLQTIGMGGGV